VWDHTPHLRPNRDGAAIGAPTVTEAAIVLQAKGAPPSLLPALMQRSALRIVSFTERHATVAADAYATYGRGRHPASLNFGDCMTYAVARLADAPLLFVGDDFSRTDLVPALR
jgi:ribonuclease VapC